MKSSVGGIFSRATSLGPRPSLFIFFVFFVFLGGFKGQVRWPKGPPHLALNPPFFVFSFCSFLPFFAFNRKLFPPPKKGHFCLSLSVSLCFSLTFLASPLFHFLFFSFSLFLLFFFLSFLLVFFWFLVFVFFFLSFFFAFVS